MIFLGLGGSLWILYSKGERAKMVSNLLAGGEYLPSGPDHKCDLGLGLNEEVTVLLGGALGVDDSLVGIGVLLSVLSGVGGGDLSGFSTGLLLGGANVS